MTNLKAINFLTVVGSLSDSDIPRSISTTLRRHRKDGVVSYQTPQSLCAALHGHDRSVNAVHWSGTHGK